MSPQPAIVGSHLRAGYRGHPVLHDLTFQINEGECVAVTGNNGSGKSTLLKTLIGTIPLMGGTVTILGQSRTVDFIDGPPPWYELGYVPQRLTSAGGVESTVTEVVQSGLLGSGHFRLPRSWRAEVKEALGTVGMSHRQHEPFQSLSGGQQQRVLIARALVRRPRLLLFDEPLTGLDEHNRTRLAEIIRESLGSGCTAVLVLHELGELRPLIQREIQLSSGHIAYDGPCTHKHHGGGSNAWWDHDEEAQASAEPGQGVWGGIDA